MGEVFFLRFWMGLEHWISTDTTVWSLEYCIRTYGYLALFIGTFLEGEIILIIAGAAAYNGYLRLPWVILLALGGSFLGDQLAFYLSRLNKKFLLNRMHCWKKKVDRVHQLMLKYQVPLLIGFRFFYGLRNVTPFVLGTTSLSAWRFFYLNLTGAIVWVFSFAYGGYFLGTMFEVILERFKHIQLYILSGLILSFFIFWIACLLNKVRAAEELVDKPMDQTIMSTESGIFGRPREMSAGSAAEGGIYLDSVAELEQAAVPPLGGLSSIVERGKWMRIVVWFRGVWRCSSLTTCLTRIRRLGLRMTRR
ncbi:membrane-associated protein [Desulfovibrionales bacterium]